ncbi:unnamed protein product, partial [Urochloa humidicola]
RDLLVGLHPNPLPSSSRFVTPSSTRSSLFSTRSFLLPPLQSVAQSKIVKHGKALVMEAVSQVVSGGLAGSMRDGDDAPARAGAPRPTPARNVALMGVINYTPGNLGVTPKCLV